MAATSRSAISGGLPARTSIPVQVREIMSGEPYATVVATSGSAANGVW